MGYFGPNYWQLMKMFDIILMNTEQTISNEGIQQMESDVRLCMNMYRVAGLILRHVCMRILLTVTKLPQTSLGDSGPWAT